MLVRIQCQTQGASIAYTTDPGHKPHWKLYTEPLTFQLPVTVRAKAIRLGYKESPEARLDLKDPSAPSPPNKMGTGSR